MKNNMIYKHLHRFRLFSLLGGMLLTSSCADLLDEQVYTMFPTNTFFEGLESMDTAVLQCYSPFQSSATYGKTMFGLFDGDSDIQVISGSGAPTGNVIRDASHYYIAPNATVFESVWQIFYRGINNANLVLEMVPKVQTINVTEDVRLKRLVAETKFLRGLMYFDLVRFWGDVPLKLDVTTVMGANFQMKRTNRDLVYAQIVKDLEEAVPDLPWHDEVIFEGRATKGAAMGMLVRVQLYRGGYSLYQDGTRHRPEKWEGYYRESIKWADKLIASGKHKLSNSYEGLFRNQCQSVWEPTENLYEVDFVCVNGLGEGAIGSYNGVSTKKGVYNQTTIYVRTNYVPYSKFGKGDKRREVAIANYSLNADGSRSIIEAKNSDVWNVGKWTREWQSRDQFDSKSSTNINFVVLRYADILLMKAEAMNEIGGGTSQEREDLVNQVRRRGYGLDITKPSTIADMPTGLVKEEFLKYIQDERVRELAFESIIRRTDLIRWNILGEKIKETQEFFNEYAGVYIKETFDFTAAKLFTENKHELYPIPERELRENPGLYPQNPNY